MKSSIKKTVAAAALVMTATSTVTADACDRGGRISIGRSYGYSVPRPTYRHYAPPTYSQPTYSQPQHVYSQPAPVSRPAAPQHISPQPVPRQPAPTQVPQQVPTQVAPRPQATPQQLILPASQRVTQATVHPSTVRPSTVRPSTVRPSTVRTVAATRSATSQASNQPNAATSALQLLASMNSTSTQPATPQSVRASTPRPTVTTAQNSNSIPEFTTSSASIEGHVGTWNVKLSGNQSVELTLNDDRSFTWTATKQGKASSFNGQYRLESGRLTLVRSSDLQQMAGSWSGQDAHFTFKLDGATNSGLTFTRA